MVLSDFTFHNKGVFFISAYSGDEAKRLVQEHPDTAIMLLDVVMETEDSGLQVAQYVRDEIKNSFIRIILRTGYPGQAPERRVIVDYDINDYKEKAELTAQKLTTAIIASLRSYRDLKIIDGNRRGLEKIIDAAPTLFKFTSMDKFTSGVLMQLTSLIHLEKSALYGKSSGFAATHQKQDLHIVTGTGVYSNCVNKLVSEVIPYEMLDELNIARQKNSPHFIKNCCFSFFKSQTGSENLLYLEGIDVLSDWINI